MSLFLNRVEMNKIEKITLVKKNWGTEEIIVNNDKYCAKMMTLVPNGKLSLQWHKDKQETFFVLSGSIYVDLYEKDGTKEIEYLSEGDSITILPCQAHSFHNPLKENVKFLEISTTHNDGSGENNFIENLRYDTHKNNIKDEIKHRTKKEGSKCWNAKLNDNKIVEIRKLTEENKLSQREIAIKFNVSQHTIWNIINKKTWKHI